MWANLAATGGSLVTIQDTSGNVALDIQASGANSFTFKLGSNSASVSCGYSKLIILIIL